MYLARYRIVHPLNNLRHLLSEALVCITRAPTDDSSIPSGNLLKINWKGNPFLLACRRAKLIHELRPTEAVLKRSVKPISNQ